MLSPAVSHFFDLKDTFETHTETDYSVKYNTDSTSPYPTKDDLNRVLEIMYKNPKELSSFKQRITTLFEARKDKTKVSIPGLIHEIKQAYPTREEFEKALEEINQIFPDENMYNLVLDKMAFLHVPVQYIMEQIQAKINTDEDSFDTRLSEEDELKIFGNISENENTVRYSYEPYARHIAHQYKKRYQDEFGSDADIETDANKYFRFFTPIQYSYEFKNEALTSLLSVIKNSPEFKNAGVIPSGISEDGTKAYLDYIIGIGIDPNLTSAIQVHYNKKNVLDFISQYSDDTILPVYEGMEDFEGVSNQAILPFTKDIEKYLKALVKDPSLSEEASRYVKRIYSLATGKIPDHLCTDVSRENSKKKKFEFKRRYVDITTGTLYEMVNGKYVPLAPKSTTIEHPNADAKDTSTSKKEDSYEL